MVLVTMETVICPRGVLAPWQLREESLSEIVPSLSGTHGS